MQVATVLDKKLFLTTYLNLTITYMKAPSQWINAWQTEDTKRLKLLDCSMHVTKIVDKKSFPVL